MRFAATRFRPLFGRVLSALVAGICLSGIVGFAVAGQLENLLRYSGLLLLVAALALVLYWLPSVDVAEHGVTVRNVFSTVQVPWTAIERIDTRFALTLYTADGTITAWAAPAPNRFLAHDSSRGDARLAARASGAHPRPGDLPVTVSGAAAFVIRRHWEELRQDGVVEGGPAAQAVDARGAVARDIHWVQIGVLLLLATAAVLGIVL